MKARDINLLAAEGNLAADCVTKTIGDSVLVKFRLCVSNGDRPTTYIDCEWWNPNGAVEYLKRGKKVHVIGRLLQNDWEDKDTKTMQHKHFIGVRELELRLSAVKRDEDATKEEEPVLAGDIKDVPF